MITQGLSFGIEYSTSEYVMLLSSQSCAVADVLRQLKKKTREEDGGVEEIRAATDRSF